MRIPFRLAAILLNARYSEISRRAKRKLPMWCIQVSDANGEELASAADFATDVAARAAVVWMTSSGESFADLSKGKFARQLAGQLQDAGRTVFFETDGGLWRRRVHEFRPDGRLYLTIRLFGTASSHDLRMQRQGAFEAGMEGIRAAQLSGFLICAHVMVDGESDLGDVKLLLEQLRRMDVEGVVITAMNAEGDLLAAVQKKVSEARKLIGHSWWAAFSRVVQESLNAGKPGVASFAGAKHAAREMTSGSEARTAQNAATSSGEVVAQ